MVQNLGQIGLELDTRGPFAQKRTKLKSALLTALWQIGFLLGKSHGFLGENPH